jgi:transcriptional regulator with XRE-family HTH domain
MPRRKGASRAAAVLEGRRQAGDDAQSLGAKVRSARKRRRWSQRALGEMVGLTQTRLGQIERGLGATASLEVWHAIASALAMPLRVELGRDSTEEALDAGHLAIQELMLRLARETGRAKTFELATKPANPSYSIDVGTRDDANRVLIIQECWNSFGNINESVRSTRRKIAEAEQLAVAIGGENGPYRVAAVWIVRDTRRNREILTRYPEVFASAFTGSSMEWVRALITVGAAPPAELGLVWCDLRATKVFAWRKR